MKFTKLAYIYILIDPTDGKVRYVGKTFTPKNRLSGHITECKNIEVNHHRARWIRSLLKKGKKPLLEIVKICDEKDFEKYETYYIKKFKSRKLTNSDENGQGNKNRKKEILKRISKKLGKEVYQFNIEGIFIKKFDSVREAAKKLNLSHANISRCCNGLIKHTGGFIFKYEKVNVESIENPNAIRKVVVEIDGNGDEICRWNSLMDCSRSTGIDNGNLSRVCNGKIAKIKGRNFKFEV